MAAPGASVVPGPWGRATDMWGKAAGRCSLQGKPAVLTAILVKLNYDRLERTRLCAAL